MEQGRDEQDIPGLEGGVTTSAAEIRSTEA